VRTTLVLEPHTPDFSTDVGNSALIVPTKSPQRPAAPFRACPAERRNHNNKSKKQKQKQQDEISV
jgi:hypothetical protein